MCFKHCRFGISSVFCSVTRITRHCNLNPPFYIGTKVMRHFLLLLSCKLFWVQVLCSGAFFKMHNCRCVSCKNVAHWQHRAVLMSDEFVCIWKIICFAVDQPSLFIHTHAHNVTDKVVLFCWGSLPPLPSPSFSIPTCRPSYNHDLGHYLISH